MHGAGVGHPLQVGQTARLNRRADYARGGTIDDDQEHLHDEALSATCMPQPIAGARPEDELPECRSVPR